MKIAVVEDNETFADQVALVLQKEGYEVEVYYDGNKFLENFSETIDLLLLDINLPGIDGLEVLESLREAKCDIKTIFVTSHTEIGFLKEAYKLGCEDYIKKPFNLEELLLRIRRVEKLIYPDDLVVMQQYKFDLNNYLVYINGAEIKITKNEAELLKIFLANVDNVVTFEYLNAKIWDGEASSNTITVAVLRLKKKLQLTNLENIREIGYIFHKL
jgi:DNA-binding response OmpR family regulator